MTKSSTTELDKHIGARIKMLRKQQGISASAVAEELGITQQQFSRYELGNNKISASLLYRIARFFDTPFSWFFLQAEIDQQKLYVRQDTPQYLQSESAEQLDMISRLWPSLTQEQRTMLLQLAESYMRKT